MFLLFIEEIRSWSCGHQKGLIGTIPSTITLLGQSKWNAYVSIIKCSARQSDIWEFIEPSKDEEPILTEHLFRT